MSSSTFVRCHVDTAKDCIEARRFSTDLTMRRSTPMDQEHDEYSVFDSKDSVCNPVPVIHINACTLAEKVHVDQRTVWTTIRRFGLRMIATLIRQYHDIMVSELDQRTDSATIWPTEVRMIMTTNRPWQVPWIPSDTWRVCHQQSLTREQRLLTDQSELTLGFGMRVH